jgi:hypothetical protein
MVKRPKLVHGKKVLKLDAKQKQRNKPSSNCHLSIINWTLISRLLFAFRSGVCALFQNFCSSIFNPPWLLRAYNLKKN